MNTIYQLKDRTLGQVLENKAKENRDKVYCYYKDQVVTYAELNETANRVANALIKMGLNKGEKVCILMHNCPDYLYAIFGLAKVGIIEVPLNTSHKGNILKYMINYSDAEVMIISKDLLDNVKFIEEELEKLKTIIVYPNSNGISDFRFEILSWQEILSNPCTKPSVDVRHLDPVAIIFTSGTTGPSKGVVESHNQYIWFGEHRVKELKLTPDDIIYVWFPLFHVASQGAFMMSALLADASICLTERFSLRAFWNEIRRSKVTVTGAFSQQIQLLYNLPEMPDDADNPLRVILVGLVPKAIHDAFEKRFNLVLIDEYGMTEADPICHQDYENRKKGSCGREMEGFEIKVFDENENEVEPYSPGEIVVRPKSPFIMMLGYYKDSEATLKAWRNLWFHTGDLAYMDKEGDIYFVDRKKDSIRRRGENISSLELESVINSHLKVLASAAVGVPSELGEDDVKVVVKVKEEESLLPEELLRFCEERMAFFMVPRYIEFVNEFPLTETGKIKKEELKTMTEKTWDREKAGFKLRR
jgi:crotonobetaine/carnitine-CoA ligase